MGNVHSIFALVRREHNDCNSRIGSDQDTSAQLMQKSRDIWRINHWRSEPIWVTAASMMLGNTVMSEASGSIQKAGTMRGRSVASP